MKKFLFALFAVLFCVGTASAFIDKYTINRSELPEESQAFLDKYFSKAKISMIKVDRHLLRKADYDVKLVNGTKFEFNSRGGWTSVDCGKREVPDGIVPSAVIRHIKKNFDSLPVNKIVKKSSSFEVTLSDGVRLKYDRLGIYKGVLSIDEDKD